MDFAQKQSVYSEIEWLFAHARIANRTEVKNRLFSVFKALLSEDGYFLTPYQVIAPPESYEKMFFVLPFEFSAFNKSNRQDKIGILFHDGTEQLTETDLRIFFHNAETQKCPRTIVVIDGVVSKEARARIFKTLAYKIELIDFYFLKHWLAKFEMNIDNIEEVEVLFKSLNIKLAKLISNDPEHLMKIEWRDLERLLAEVLGEFGFQVELTPPSKDGGKDIILICLNQKTQKSYIVEIKHWRAGSKVGGGLIKDFINVIINEKRDKGLYLSTYGYTDNAFETLTELEKRKVNFGEKEKIVSLCNLYSKKRNGIWIPTQPPEEILFSETIGA